MTTYGVPSEASKDRKVPVHKTGLSLKRLTFYISTTIASEFSDSGKLTSALQASPWLPFSFVNFHDEENTQEDVHVVSGRN